MHLFLPYVSNLRIRKFTDLLFNVYPHWFILFLCGKETKLRPNVDEKQAN